MKQPRTPGFLNDDAISHCFYEKLTLMTIKVFVILIQDIKINVFFFPKTKVQEREFVHILLINSFKYTEISIFYRLFKICSI